MPSDPLQVPRDARILAINVARIGDTLLATPALAALKAAAPGGWLTCLAHPKRLDVLRGLPAIDELGGITKRRAFWRGRCGKKYDAAFVWGRDKALVAYALRIARRVVAFEQGDAALDRALAVAVPWPDQAGHAVDHRCALLAAAGIAAAGRRLTYRVSEQERTWAKRWLAGHFGSDAGLLPVCLQTASFPTKPYRNWPEENFVDLGKRLLDHDRHIGLILLGDGGDRERATRIARACGPRAVVSAGRLTLRQSAALISAARLYVGVDTGMTHIAGALGVPMAALYHCLHPGVYLAPLEHPAPLAVIEHPDTGGPCDETAGMDRIPVAAVWDAIGKILAEPYSPVVSDS